MSFLITVQDILELISVVSAGSPSLNGYSWSSYRYSTLCRVRRTITVGVSAFIFRHLSPEQSLGMIPFQRTDLLLL
jgi:hypothetical protein